MCVVEQWDRVYQDGRREPQQTLYYCPDRNEPGHGGIIQIRTLQDEHMRDPPLAFRSNTSRTAGMAEYPIIEPRSQPEVPAEQKTDKKDGKKKAPVVTKNGGFKLNMRFHIPFTSKTPKPKKEPKVKKPVIEVVEPPEPQTRPTFTYRQPQPFARGPSSPYRRQSFERYRDHIRYHAEPRQGPSTHQPVQPDYQPVQTSYRPTGQPTGQPLPTYPIAEPVPLRPAERRSRSRQRRSGVEFEPVPAIPVPPLEPRDPGVPAATVVVPEEREESPPVFRQHLSRHRRPVIIDRSPSRDRRTRTRDSTPAPRIPNREHLGRRMPRAPSPPRRNHSPRRLRRIEQDIQRVERALRSARHEAQREDAERRERRLVRIERDLQTLYDQQNAEIELEHQLRVVREARARFVAERGERIERDRRRPLTIHQTLLHPRRERSATRDRNDFEERGMRVINQAIRDRREERENRDGRNERRGDGRIGRRESSTHREHGGRSGRSGVQRRNTISGRDHYIWDDDRERRGNRWV